ncbi:MAG TPA: type II toxin-antitoxin system RelE/ParE family toxin [Thermomicrobiales bacterium]|jgi:toxin ParE1/3/4
MSARRRRLTFTPEARQDIRDILIYTEGRWGKRQRSTYKTKLDQGIQILVRYPYRGQARDDVSPGLRGLLVEAHTVYYRVEDKAVNVIRVLHSAMDVASHIRH